MSMDYQDLLDGIIDREVIAQATNSLEMLRDGLANYMLRVEPNSRLTIPPPVRESYFIDKTH